MEIIKKIFSLFRKPNYNTGFSSMNQPCFDINGKFLGWFSRSMAVAVFVFGRDKNGIMHVLASERGTGAADFNGMWNCPCGYLDFNETTSQAASRELLEETGVNIPHNKIEFVGFEDSPDANHQNVTFRFRAIIDDATIDSFTFSHRLNEKDEVGEIKWIPINEVDNYKWAFGHLGRIKEYCPR